MGNTIVNYGTNTAIRSNTFTKTGYTFAGWTTRTDGVDDGYNWTGWSGTWKYVDGQYIYIPKKKENNIRPIGMINERLILSFCIKSSLLLP